MKKQSVLPWVIVAAFVLFAFFIGRLVYKSSQIDLNLVSETYYQDELEIQERVKSQANADALGTALQIEHQANQEIVRIEFPKTFEIIKGTAHLYRPSDANQDRKLAINLKNQTQFTCPTDGLTSGQWILKLQFEADGKSFYSEKYIHI